MSSKKVQFTNANGQTLAAILELPNNMEVHNFRIFAHCFTCNKNLITDEPEKVAGNDFGPSPYEFVSSGLGACTAMTLRMYADRKKWSLEKVVVHIDYGKEYADDCDDLNSNQKIDQFIRKI